MFTETVPYPAAFLAGLFSFFSPCILPLIPAYFTFITGFTLEELTGNPDAAVKKRVLFSTGVYILGFSFVFILMGASASYLGGFIYNYRNYIRIVGGIVIVILGIHLTGLIRIRHLELEKRVHLKRKPLYFGGTFVVGMAFAAGWSPCIGPLLGSILIIASNQETVWQGIVLLGVYSAGLAIPFIIISIFINLMFIFLARIAKPMKYLNLAAGILLILAGLSLMANKINLLAG